MKKPPQVGRNKSNKTGNNIKKRHTTLTKCCRHNLKYHGKT